MDDSYDAASTAYSSEYEEETTNTTSECLPNALGGFSYNSSRDIHSADNSFNPDVSLSPEQLWRGAGIGRTQLATTSTISNNGGGSGGGASGEGVHTTVAEEEIASAPKSPETAMLYQSARRGTDAPSSIEPSPCIQPVVKANETETSYESVADEEYDVDEEEEDVADEEYEDDAEEEVPFKAAISEGASSSSVLQSSSVADVGMAASASNSKPHLIMVDDGTPLDMAPHHPVAAAASSRDTNTNTVKSSPSWESVHGEGTAIVLADDTSAGTSPIIIGDKNDTSLSLDNMPNSVVTPALHQEVVVASNIKDDADDMPLTHNNNKTVTQSPKLDASSSSDSPFTPVAPPPPTFPTPKEDGVHPIDKEDSSSVSSASYTPLTQVELSAISPTGKYNDATTAAIVTPSSHTSSSHTASNDETTLKVSHHETIAATESKHTKSSSSSDDNSMPVVPAAVEGVSVIAVVPDEVSPSTTRSSISSLQSYKSKSKVSPSSASSSNNNIPSMRSSSSSFIDNEENKNDDPSTRFQYMTEEERRSHQVLMKYVLLAEEKMNRDWRTRSLDDCRSTLAKMIPNRQQALAKLEKR